MQHIRLKCKKHPCLTWSAKSIAVNKDGSYNGMRNIFFFGQVPETNAPEVECRCPPTELTFFDEGEKKRWEEDNNVPG